MNKKSVAKKIVALTGATFLAGLTIASGVSAQLGDYPSQFMDDGQFDGKIVVGANAAAEDIIGAIDVAASLQAASVSPVDTGDAVTVIDVEGDAARVETTSDIMEIREAIQDVEDTYTEDDLAMLEGGRVTTDEGTTEYSQELKVMNASVDLYENHDDETGVFLFFDHGDLFAEYELDFTSGLESDVDAGTVEDFEDEVIYIMGKAYTISNADWDGTDLTLDMLAGEVSDTLQEGETKTYTVDGEEYEVTVLVVGESSGDTTVKFLVNGEVSDALEVDDTEDVGGIEIGVREIIETTAYRESDPSSIVEFYLGADKLQIVAPVDGSWNSNALSVNEEEIGDVDVALDGTFSATSAELDTISFRYYVEEADDSGVYVGEGEGLRQYLDEELIDGMLADWDIYFAGLTEPTTFPIAFDRSGEGEIELTFENVRGNEYTVPFMYEDDATDDLLFGDEDEALHIVEAAAGAFPIQEDDWFIVSEGNADDDNTYVLQFTGVDEDDEVIEYEHDGTSDTAGWDSGNLTAGATGTIDIGGEEWTFTVQETGVGTGVYQLEVDLDGDGSFTAGDFVPMIARGGAIIEVDSYNQTDGDLTLNISTDEDQLDDATVNEITQVSFSTDAVDPDEEAIDISLSASTVEIGNSDVFLYYSTYGALFELDEGDDTETLTIEYPNEQVEAVVYVVGGDVRASSRTVGAGEAAQVNVLPVGLAVLDTEIDVDDSNIISVGGPCANSVSAELLGNPADCAEGFEPGMGMIRYFDTGDNVAILVAGFSAQDTVQTSQVLARAATEDVANFDGESVEVVIAGANDVTVRAAVEAEPETAEDAE